MIHMLEDYSGKNVPRQERDSLGVSNFVCMKFSTLTPDPSPRGGRGESARPSPRVAVGENDPPTEAPLPAASRKRRGWGEGEL
ncbi:MAG: hypothetical protein K8I82_27585 [Anaerolineae bacterium]|nr:hypothetical protein [Anaerolineae bacterium]